MSFLLSPAPLQMFCLFLELCLFLESIEHGLYKGLNDSQRQPNSDFAQLTEQETDDQEVVSSNPTGDNFLTKLILLCVT